MSVRALMDDLQRLEREAALFQDLGDGATLTPDERVRLEQIRRRIDELRQFLAGFGPASLRTPRSDRSR